MAESTVTQTESGAGLPRSRSVAKDFGVARYYTGKPCKHGHLSERSTSSGQCVACRMELQRRTKRDQSVYNETKRIWSQKNRQSVIESKRKWREKNPEKQREAEHRWKNNNAERHNAINRAWGEKNKAKRIAYCRERRANKLNATPQWADREAILAYYENAQNMTEQEGEKYNIDHIVPLQSNLVCGLHVEANLQIIKQRENQSKGNRWWPDMPDAVREQPR